MDNQEVRSDTEKRNREKETKAIQHYYNEQYMDIESINSRDFSSEKEDTSVDSDSTEMSIESKNRGQDTPTFTIKKQGTWGKNKHNTYKNRKQSQKQQKYKGIH